ncbi:hypothetical protein [Lentzea albidocapillata]|uniref:DUF2637 domain-containing protein n=1 Tax=Lentzea albidocapillata TaxID=40571 RepID=A0A1W2BF66_9PSEU|nr:hypothetical protein [Lentzea albidocapillata]SMC71481.1 hypothetical protein SAMN05660733_01449 [Lentzea albidocapillata]
MSGQAERGAGDLVVRAVTVIMAAVVGLTFLFGFGNVLSLGLRLGVPVWVAPLVAPAVDLSILGLLLGIRHLALAGAPLEVLRPARRLLMFASLVTLALNVADPIVAGEYGKAAFDAVGPLLLIGWAEVGPGLLQAIGSTVSLKATLDRRHVDVPEDLSVRRRVGSRGRSSEQLLNQARQEDAAHRAELQKPISAEVLRARLAIGSAAARQLVKIVRAEAQSQQARGTGVDASRQPETVDPILLA